MQIDLGGVRLSNFDDSEFGTQYIPGYGDVVIVDGFGIDGTGQAYFDTSGVVPAHEQAYLVVDHGGVVVVQ